MEWLKEWSPVFTIFIAFFSLVATIIIAVILIRITGRQWLTDIRKRELSELQERQRRELTELIEWARRAIPLKAEYDKELMGSLTLKDLVTKILSVVAEYDRMSKIVEGFKTFQSGKDLRKWFKKANANLKLLLVATLAKQYRQDT